MLFELFRLSLLGRQRTLFDQPDPLTAAPNPREAFLRAVLAERIEFRHRNQAFHYVPDPELQRESGLIVGRVGRRRTSKEHEPPDSGLKETERDVWHACLLVIDPTAHGDGQKVAIERDISVATPAAVLSSFLGALNRRSPPLFYVVEFQPIAQAETFWVFVEHHPEITMISFELIAPNMFGIHDDWDADRRDLKLQENADKTKLQLESKDGLNVRTPRIRKGVEQAGKGTGRVKARARDGTKYTSDSAIQTVQTEDKTEDITWNDLIKKIVRRIFGV